MKKSLLERPPRGRQTLKELQELQKLAGSVIMQPLAPGFKSRKNFSDGRTNEEVASTFIKPNARHKLTPFDRIGIYNKQYWYRLVDIMYDDYPGVLALMGRLRFNRFIQSYLDQYPSKSFLLRDLGGHIAPFLDSHPELLPKTKIKLVQEMAAFEWAQVVAFDEPGQPALTIDDLLGKNPANLKMGVQPYVTLLHLHWPLDDFTIQLKRSSLRGEASNAVDAPTSKETAKVKLPRRQEIFVAVHRLHNDLYYKRMDREAYLLLTQLRDGKTLEAAVEATMQQSDESAEWVSQIQAWFESWTGMGWFYKK